ncbi:hypothetical protein ILUMI_24010 [Ignelater luminosus]|uniref:Uncharacterized protein n=1 Tax=Ignelater luminosus TaxID=2038154 RepID=A0A8K0C9W2_IGNLU|nr:hypothetical protein ILUMI_24010 [Ignelater luminosus]
MVNKPSFWNDPEMVRQAYVRGFISTNIIKRFSTTNIYPYNPHMFANTDFLSSEVMNRPLPNLSANDPQASTSVEASTSKEILSENQSSYDADPNTKKLKLTKGATELRKPKRDKRRKIYIDETSPESKSYNEIEVENKNADEEDVAFIVNLLYSHSKTHEF